MFTLPHFQLHIHSTECFSTGYRVTSLPCLDSSRDCLPMGYMLPGLSDQARPTLPPSRQRGPHHSPDSSSLALLLCLRGLPAFEYVTQNVICVLFSLLPAQRWLISLTECHFHPEMLVDFTV